MGDLNSYAMEDPITEIKNAGYTNLIEKYQGPFAYSYTFDGQAGYLDHALASPNLDAQVTGAADWHINSDESDVLDYDTSFKPPAQDALFEANHDPVVVGLDVCDEVPPTIDELSVSPNVLWPANHKYVDVAVTIAVSDNFDPVPSVALVSVTSNESDNGLGDGDTPTDIQILDDTHFQLRAERSALGTGRVYTITYTVTDDCGNSATQSVTVGVPLNRGN